MLEQAEDEHSHITHELWSADDDLVEAIRTIPPDKTVCQLSPYIRAVSHLESLRQNNTKIIALMSQLHRHSSCMSDQEKELDNIVAEFNRGVEESEKEVHAKRNAKQQEDNIGKIGQKEPQITLIEKLCPASQQEGIVEDNENLISTPPHLIDTTMNLQEPEAVVNQSDQIRLILLLQPVEEENNTGEDMQIDAMIPLPNVIMVGHELESCGAVEYQKPPVVLQTPSEVIMSEDKTQDSQVAENQQLPLVAQSLPDEVIHSTICQVREENKKN